MSPTPISSSPSSPSHQARSRAHPQGTAPALRGKARTGPTCHASLSFGRCSKPVSWMGREPACGGQSVTVFSAEPVAIFSHEADNLGLQWLSPRVPNPRRRGHLSSRPAELMVRRGDLEEQEALPVLLCPDPSEAPSCLLPDLRPGRGPAGLQLSREIRRFRGRDWMYPKSEDFLQVLYLIVLPRIGAAASGSPATRLF